jgi:hypothetical protein
MTSVFARLCFAAAIVFGAIGVSAPVMAETAPTASAGSDWTDAEMAELRSIMQDVMVPMLNDLSSAVQTLQTDRTGACTAAKSAAARLGEADRRLNALYAKVKAEGRDLGRFDELLAKLREMKTQVPDFAAKVCDGSLAAAQAQDNDPAAKAAEDKVMTLLRRYTNDMTAATEARNAGDTAKACLSLKDGLATLDELDAYMHELAKTYAHTAADDEELRNIYAQIQTWRTQTLEAAKDCPAS